MRSPGSSCGLVSSRASPGSAGSVSVSTRAVRAVDAQPSICRPPRARRLRLCGRQHQERPLHLRRAREGRTASLPSLLAPVLDRPIDRYVEAAAETCARGTLRSENSAATIGTGTSK